MSSMRDSNAYAGATMNYPCWWCNVACTYIYIPFYWYCVRPQSSDPEEGPPPYQFRHAHCGQPLFYIPSTLLQVVPEMAMGLEFC